MSEPNWQQAAPDDWDGEYIDVAIDEEAGIVRLRESGNPDVVVTTTIAKWNAFVSGVKAGEFDHFVADVEEEEEEVEEQESSTSRSTCRSTSRSTTARSASRG